MRSLLPLQRCTPKRWRTLVGLLRRSLGQGDSSQLAAKLSRKEWQGALSPWLTAYLLARQQDGAAAAAGGGESSRGQPTLAAGEEEAVEPLPAEFLAACVSKAAAERSRKKRFAGPGHARAAKVSGLLCGRPAPSAWGWVVCVAPGSHAPGAGSRAPDAATPGGPNS